MRTCTYCGKENEDAASFCAGCGDSLADSSHSFPAISDEKKRQRVVFAWIGLVIGVVGTGLVMLMSFPFFFVPHGRGIRPMAWAAALILIAGGSFLTGLPCSLLGTTSNKRLIGWLGAGFCLAPGPLGFAMLHIAMTLRGFELEE